jgi:hypothetical protein
MGPFSQAHPGGCFLRQAALKELLLQKNTLVIPPLSRGYLKPGAPPGGVFLSTPLCGRGTPDHRRILSLRLDVGIGLKRNVASSAICRQSLIFNDLSGQTGPKQPSRPSGREGLGNISHSTCGGGAQCLMEPNRGQYPGAVFGSRQGTGHPPVRVQAGGFGGRESGSWCSPVSAAVPGYESARTDDKLITVYLQKSVDRTRL